MRRLQPLHGVSLRRLHLRAGCTMRELHEVTSNTVATVQWYRPLAKALAVYPQRSYASTLLYGSVPAKKLDMFIDCHCHLTSERFQDDLEAI